MTEEELRAQMVAGCWILTRRGFVEGFGHISARLETGEVLITPRKPLALVQAEEIVRVDLSGKVAGAEEPPPIETPMHLAVYRQRPEVGAIARTYSLATSTFSAMGEPIRPVHGVGSHLGDEVPVYPEVMLISTPERAEGVANALGQRVALLLRGSGTLVTGGNLVEAVVRAIWLEESAQIMWRIRAAGGVPRFLSSREIASMRTEDPTEPIRAWNYEVAMLEAR